MRFSAAVVSLVAALTVASASPVESKRDNVVEVVEEIIVYEDCDKIKPKVFIISMFKYEADVWYDNDELPGSIGSLFARNITVPGFSPLFPDAHCLADGSVCQLTTGESEINAAVTISSLLASGLFDLTTTYFMIAGIAGINPKHGTIADVAFSKYAIQVALQYEFDAREIPQNFSTGYFPQGSFAPDQYPQSIYGTEVFEVNEALRDIAVGFAATGLPFNDTAASKAYRANYAPGGTGAYAAATKEPGIIKCDVATSDVYYSGTLLGEAFENTTKLFTNGSGVYCMTAQEDNATLEAMLRGAINKLVDFSRIIIMRTASDFDRPYPGTSVEFNLLYSDQDAFGSAIANIYIAGVKVVQGILNEWNSTFAKGIKAPNYIGDIFGSLGGAPDFGPGSITNDQPVDLSDVPITRRDLYKREVADDGIVRRVNPKGLSSTEIARAIQERM
ncbi:MAG: hypothetical protein M1818_002518 [Claussenomyces sp. TS43310]|nr:MAG: hypothetical protein M1818_002518 [Claussenomyces sp. TS43310]